MKWAVIEWIGYEPVQVSKVNAQTLAYVRNGREGRVSLSKVYGRDLDEEAARLLAARLTYAKSEQRKLEQAAREWFQKERDRYVAAAMERAENPA